MCWEAVPEINDPNRKVVFAYIVLEIICAQFQRAGTARQYNSHKRQKLKLVNNLLIAYFTIIIHILTVSIFVEV